MPVLLATDVLLWLLVAAAAIYFGYCRRHPHLAAPWRRVLQSRAALASLVVLAAFFFVGLLDSLHFRPAIAGTDAYSNEVLSVMDTALAHLRTNREKTYSEPFATRLYAKEQIETADGKTVRDYPRLVYGAITFQQSGVFGVCLDLGGRHAGAIVGLMNTAAQVGGFVSSIAFGYLVNRFGSYDAPFVPMAAMLFTGAILWLRIDASQVIALDDDRAAAD